VYVCVCVVDTDWADIAFHYLLDSEGFVYEARDPHAIPSAVLGYTHLYTPRVCCAKVKVRTLDIAPLCETPPQNRSGMARVLKGSHSFTCTPARLSTIGMSQACLCLPSYSWYSFTDPGWMEG